MRSTWRRGLLNDPPNARLVWLDSGHFVLDENTPQVACEIKAAFAAARSVRATCAQLHEQANKDGSSWFSDPPPAYRVDGARSRGSVNARAPVQ